MSKEQKTLTRRSGNAKISPIIILKDGFRIALPEIGRFELSSLDRCIEILKDYGYTHVMRKLPIEETNEL